MRLLELSTAASQTLVRARDSWMGSFLSSFLWSSAESALMSPWLSLRWLFFDSLRAFGCFVFFDAMFLGMFRPVICRTGFEKL